MYSSFVSDAIQSAKNYYNYAQENKTSRIVVNITNISQNSSDIYTLFLSQKLNRPDSTALCIASYLIRPEWYAEKGESYISSNLYEVIQADNLTHSIKVKIKNPLLSVFNSLEKENITIVSDLKFLIKNVEKWYTEFGSQISLPPEPFVSENEMYFRGDHSKDTQSKESREQKNAVRIALSKNISYVWGAPGTGKTQYVLADCLLTYINRGDKVLVLAPTNNAIEQTLLAVIKTMEEQNANPECIYRLGIPTATFAAKYPNLCERVDHNATLESLQCEIEDINRQIQEQEKADIIIKNYSAFSSIYNRYQNTFRNYSEEKNKSKKLLTKLSELKSLVSEKNDEIIGLQSTLRRLKYRENTLGYKFKALFTSTEVLEIDEKKSQLLADIEKLQNEIDYIKNDISNTDFEYSKSERMKINITNNQESLRKDAENVICLTFGGFYYKSLSDADNGFRIAAEKAEQVTIDTSIYEKLKAKEAEYEILSENSSKIMNQKQVFAFTVDYFFAHYAQLTKDDLGIISHIFLDEAAYCPLIKSGILYSLGVPVTLLGDHMQLTPICEAGKSATNRIDTKIFLWEQSAIYLPQIFDKNASIEALFERYDLIHNAEDITKVNYYSEENIYTATLPKTHRFGNNLAAILDKFVYKNNFHGNKDGHTQTYFLHAKRLPSEYGNRTSTGEVDTIKQLILREKYSDCVVMTPYKRQRDLLQKSIGGLIGSDNILTVHASQGREWDTVILSVVDANDRDMFFTNSSIPQGLHTINTAISRVKKNLIIVCDTDFWAKKGNTQLIGSLINDSKTKAVSLPTQGKIKIAWSQNSINFYTLGIENGKLESAIKEQHKIINRFVSNIQINENAPPYASVSIASSKDKEKATYHTTLSSCTCKDFQHNSKSQSPCKHIFALALTVKLINKDGTLNKSISIPSTNVDIVE